MKILFVYPKFIPTFWGYDYALHFIDQKAIFPPLGLLTVASMLPKEWEKKLVDLNVEPLEDEKLRWADYVFITGMDIQQKSAKEVLRRCNKLGAKIVAGGPFFTEHYEDLENVNHLVLGEAETTLPRFLKDLEIGSPKHLYLPDRFPDMEKTPVPTFEILKLDDYKCMGIQFSRGCPFNCEFCHITRLFGRNVRTKNKEQIIKELDALYEIGWKDRIFFVDDNFIGSKHKVKTEILPAIIEWNEKKNYPFAFSTQASINLADDEELMNMMVRAGFDNVFVGIESFDDECLTETKKLQNRKRDLIANVKKMQRFGLKVDAGFIVGFDNDKESVFERMPQLITESGIVLAMAGLLQAPHGTRLYERLEKEKRIISEVTGDNADSTINFVPKMGKEKLLKGYREMLGSLYSPKQYYSRIHMFSRYYNRSKFARSWSGSSSPKDLYSSIRTIVKLMIFLGIMDKGRVFFWKLFFWTLLRKPRLFTTVMNLWGHGYHIRKLYDI